MADVLVVDDENEICLLLASMMNKVGFETITANTLKEGHDMVYNNKLELVFLDLNLPDGIGFELIEDIENVNKDTKIIVISAHDGNEEREEARKKGVDYFLSKPFTKQAVLDSLNQLQILTNQ